MLASTTTVQEQDRVVKRLKVDSPTSSFVHTDDSNNVSDNEVDAQQREDSNHATATLTPPHSYKEGRWSDGSNALSAENLSFAETMTSFKSQRYEHASTSVVSTSSPTRPGTSTWRSFPRMSTSATTTIHHHSTPANHGSSSSSNGSPSAAFSSLPLPVSTNGAITTLRSLSQLQTLVSSANTTSAKEKTHPDLRLKCGETVMLLLHFDETSLRSLTNVATSELSQMRVFTLNLAKLPPQDYEATPNAVKRSSTGTVVFCSSMQHMSSNPKSVDATLALSDALHGVHASPATALTLTQNTPDSQDGSEEEEEEEEELVPAVHPMAALTAAAEARASVGHERASRTSASVAATGAGALTAEDAASVSSLSVDLHQVSDTISDKLCHMLAVDTILNPHASQHQIVSRDGGCHSKPEPLLFPAMIVWRAAGAPREEYPPAPPQTYSSQPTPTPTELFCDRMSVQGGPLVVKEATSVDQVHSLTLFRPVYTMENLFRTLVRTVAPSYAKKAPGDKSRTVLYLGASWCPPCMRFVHEMPQFMREDLPSSVVCTMKADMDLAKPIYDHFKVEIIPTFVVLDNEVLMKCYDKLQHQQHGPASPSECLRAIEDACCKAELARLQNSNRQLVSTFVSKHSQTLSFDEDF